MFETTDILDMRSETRLPDKGTLHQHVVEFEIAPELMMQGYAIAGCNVHVHHTNTRGAVDAVGRERRLVNVGTIGHVSHGKTALAAAILGALKK